MIRTRLYQLGRLGRLPTPGMQRALQLTGLTPAAAAWQHHVDLLLLLLGGLLGCAGVICFFAFNWAGLHHGLKFLVIGAALTACVGFAWWRGLAASSGQAALAGACVLTGVLLAVAGQAYQTGADSELLFVGWALFILPWVALARNRWLWLFWLLLLNVAALLYLSGRNGVLWLWLSLDGSFWLVAALNGAALVLWEQAANSRPWLAGRAGPRVLHLIVAAYATPLAIWWVFRSDYAPASLTPLAYLAWLVGTAVFTLRLRRDVAVLALLALSLIVVSTCWLGNNVGRHWHDVGGLFLITLWLVVSTTTATVQLRKLAHRWETDHEPD